MRRARGEFSEISLEHAVGTFVTKLAIEGSIFRNKFYSIGFSSNLVPVRRFRVAHPDPVPCAGTQKFRAVCNGLIRRIFLC